jgi:uncharacterized membrane protein YeaQ/YmgE (transglycosylase-associated protein family)
MTFLGWILAGLVGGVAGLYATYRTTPSGATEWISAVVLGLIGGGIGGFLLGLIGIEAASWLGSAVVAFLGTWAILALYRRQTAGTGSVTRSREEAEPGPRTRDETSTREHDQVEPR